MILNRDAICAGAVAAYASILLFYAGEAPEESEYLNLIADAARALQAMQANWWAVTMRFPGTPSA